APGRHPRRALRRARPRGFDPRPAEARLAGGLGPRPPYHPASSGRPKRRSGGPMISIDAGGPRRRRHASALVTEIMGPPDQPAADRRMTKMGKAMGKLRPESHAGQSALGPRLLKDARNARRGAAGRGPVLDKPRPQGSHHP